MVQNIEPLSPELQSETLVNVKRAVQPEIQLICGEPTERIPAQTALLACCRGNEGIWIYRFASWIPRSV